MHRLTNALYWLLAHLWFIPSLIAAAGVAAAYVVLAYNVGLTEEQYAKAWWLFGGDAATARDLLSTILSGMITMTSLVVSITIVVLSLAASQLGPRLIWNFIGDRQIQAVIGLFLGTILYTLLILRSINDQLGAQNVPHIAVTLASFLAFLCLIALLFHVSALARAIVSDTMVEKVGNSLEQTFRSLPDETSNEDRGEPSYPCAYPVSFGQAGYLQVIDYESLCRHAEEHDVLLDVLIRPGHFLLKDSAHVKVHAASEPNEGLIAAVRGCAVIGATRTPTQDLEYSIRELVEIGLRALSPSLNDPFTAIAVIDRLAAALEIASTRSLGRSRYRDRHGTLRVIAQTSDFEGLVDAAFHQLRQSASGNPGVLMELARRLGDLLQVARRDAQRKPLRKHLAIVERLLPAIAEPEDRRALAQVIGQAGLLHPLKEDDHGRRTGA